MRIVATLVVMAASCRFDPTGGTGRVDDAAAVDAAAIVDAPAIDATVIDATAIDARVIDAHPPCPVSYNVLHLGRRYVFRTGAEQFAIAEGLCSGDLAGRTHLATFELPGTIDAAITAVDPGNSAQPWVGAKCPTMIGVDCNLRASWFWVTTVPIDPGAWDALQPDNGATEKVAWAERNNGSWMLVNVPADSTRPYICECEP